MAVLGGNLVQYVLQFLHVFFVGLILFMDDSPSSPDKLPTNMVRHPETIFQSRHDLLEVLRCLWRILVEVEKNARIKDEEARIPEGLELLLCRCEVARIRRAHSGSYAWRHPF